MAALLMGVAVSSAASVVPKRVYGNIGFFYTASEADGGATTNSSLSTVSLNMDSYVWRPWFANLDLGAVSSISRSESATNSSSLDLLSSHLNFSLMPRSRYPFRLSYNTSDNVTDWSTGKVTLLSLGPEYKTRYLNARQSIITLAGNRADAWYTQRTRNYAGVKLIDDTYGAKLKMRGRSYNLYANTSSQKRSNTANADETKHIMGTLTHNFFPNKEFYIKTQVTSSESDVGSEELKKYEAADQKDQLNIAGFTNRVTRTHQMSSFMYWRPDYKPYTATGGVRVYRRDTGNDALDLQDTIQQGVNANLSGNYKINRRLRMTGTATGFGLYNSGDNNYVNITASQNLLVNYRSDNMIYREFEYNWNASGGVTNQMGFKNPEDSISGTAGFSPSDRRSYSEDYSQIYSAGAGHGLSRSWVTGNRSSLRMNLNQSGREYVQTKGKRNSLGFSHSASINWNEAMKKGKFYSQLTMMDTRNIDESTESQLVNFQVSRIVPINRLSQWGSHLSAQSSRRYSSADSETSFWDGFLTTMNGRLNYQHARMFGIYKLKFRTRVEYNSTANREGGDRRQADWEGRLGYNIGKLSTALIGRKVWSDSGLGTGVIIFQVNRSF
ncbi:MAG: hypothetical protein OEM38_02500 [Gammaproteobacteria bacterium]|nr:hypothetical protein [Gammaproteobacteria bacterium]